MRDGYRKEVEDSVSDIAAYWLVRLSSADCTPDDRLEFEAWKKKNPMNERVFDRMQLHNSIADRFAADESIQKLVRQARAETRLAWWRRRNVRLTAVAATLLLAVGVSITSVVLNTEPESKPALASSVEAYETVVGERSIVTLTDGSVVTLNTDSRVEIDYSERERRIRLVRGQGYFEVAKDFSRPFSVAVAGKQVLALGTVFDVRLGNENLVQVTLVSGSVQVDDLQQNTVQPEAPSPNAAMEKIQLKPGERLVARAGAAPEITRTNAEVETSWRTGRLVFHEKGIVEAVEEINRYSTQKLVLSDDHRLRAVKVSGVFSAGKTSSFVNALEVLHPIKVRRSGSNESTLIWLE